jgi:uncharacterized protein YggE
MKKAFLMVFTLSLLFHAHSTLAQSPQASDRNLIFTEGTAEVMGQNDSARIAIGVVSYGRNLEQVSSANASKTKEVLKAIKDLNIESLKTKTSDYRVSLQKDYKLQPPKIKGYEVYNAIGVTLEEYEPDHLSRHVSKIVGKALENGANNIHHIQFYIKNNASLEKKALIQATEDALERARILANAANVKLKRIVALSTRPVQEPPGPHMLRTTAMKAEVMAVEPPIEIGESRIRVHVSLTCEIE